MKRLIIIVSALFFILASLIPIGGALAAELTTEEKVVLKEKAEKTIGLEENEDATGTDPRDFTPKFMPYWRYTELENEVMINEFVLFGMFAFNPLFAMTYEWPVAKQIDYGRADGFKQFKETGVGGDEVFPPFGPFPGGGGDLPFNDLESDGDVIGMGDLNLRFFYQIPQWRYKFMDDQKNFSVFPVLETTVPTATKDLLGGEAWILSPGITFVLDMPFKNPPFGLGFLALMNFYDFDVIKDKRKDYTSRFRGRWFWMQPLSMPAHMKDPEDDSFHFFDLAGLYLLTELQPVYDFRQEHFSFWIGPELGKIIKDGYIVYAKPGFGVDPDSSKGDRKWSFELGFRYFIR